MKRTISLLVPIKTFQLHSNSHNSSAGSYQIKTVLIGANYMASNYLIPKRVFKVTDGLIKRIWSHVIQKCRRHIKCLSELSKKITSGI